MFSGGGFLKVRIYFLTESNRQEVNFLTCCIKLGKYKGLISDLYQKMSLTGVNT